MIETTPTRSVIWPRLVAIAAVIVVAIAVGWSLSIKTSVQAQTFVVIFVSIVIQAFPFLLLGVVLSVLVRRYMSENVIAKVASLPAPLRYVAAALSGLAIPGCECGSVPVARSLANKGLQPGAAVTHMLAAPILNPLVLAATFVAFRGSAYQWQMTLARAGFGFVIAITTGVLVQRLSPDGLKPYDPSCEIDDPHNHGGRGMFLEVGSDVLELAKFLVLGAAVAALLQTVLPKGFLMGLGANIVIGTLAMMVLAVVLSLCSSSDAFVAASLRQFNPASQLAFLVLGPMVDLKLVPLYTSAFNRRTVTVIAVSATVGSAVAAVAMAWFIL